MDVDKKAKRARVVGFICLGLALLNATVAAFAMVADKKMFRGTPNLAIATSLFIVGVVSLRRGKAKPGPGA